MNFSIDMMSVRAAGIVEFGKVANEFVKEHSLHNLFNKNVRESFETVASYLPHAGFAVFSLASLGYAVTNFADCLTSWTQSASSAVDSSEGDKVETSSSVEISNQENVANNGTYFGTAAWLFEGAADLAETGFLEMSGFVNSVAQYAGPLGVTARGCDVVDSAIDVYSFAQSEEKNVTKEQAVTMMLRAAATVCKVAAFAFALAGLLLDSVPSGLALGATFGLASYVLKMAENFVGGCSSCSSPAESAESVPSLGVVETPSQVENSEVEG